VGEKDNRQNVYGYCHKNLFPSLAGECWQVWFGCLGGLSSCTECVYVCTCVCPVFVMSILFLSHIYHFENM